VPHTIAALFVPNSVAAGAVGKSPNRIGIDTSPPPPAMEFTNPAAKEANEAMQSSVIEPGVA
jgi:hypothetical protein